MRTSTLSRGVRPVRSGSAMSCTLSGCWPARVEIEVFDFGPVEGAGLFTHSDCPSTRYWFELLSLLVFVTKTFPLRAKDLGIIPAS